MAISNKRRRILLTTGNKSEMAVGYATLYGDMAGGFAPIKDCFKTLVYRLAHYRNGIAPVIPERVLTRPPVRGTAPPIRWIRTACRPTTSWTRSCAAISKRIRGLPTIVAAGFPDAEVLRVARLVDRNEYKRRQAPPGVRIYPPRLRAGSALSDHQRVLRAFPPRPIGAGILRVLAPASHPRSHS